MKNLDQIRALNALKDAVDIGKGKNDGESSSLVKKIPAMIVTNGFLGALAFAIENAGSGYEDVFKAILCHLKNDAFRSAVFSPVVSDCNNGDLKLFAETLCECDASVLRAVTAEAMNYLNFLRRFVKKSDKKEDDKK